MSKFISVLLSCMMFFTIVPSNLAYANSKSTSYDESFDKFVESFESWKVENKFIKMGETNKVTVSLKNPEDVKSFEMQFFGGKAVMTYNPSSKMFEGDYKGVCSDFEYYERFRYANIIDKDNNEMCLGADEIIEKSKLDSVDLAFQVSDFIPQFQSFEITPKDIYKDTQVNVCADVDQGAKIREIYLYYDNNVSSDIKLTKNSSATRFTGKFNVGNEQKLSEIVFSMEDLGTIVIERQYFDMCGLNTDEGDIILKDNNIENATVTTKSANYYYTGSQVTPSVTVKENNKVLVNGKDYTLSYGENKNVGKGRITVKGVNDYKGSKIVEFDIKKRSINSKKVVSTSVVSTSIENQVYTGKEIKPSVNLKQGNITLVEGVDYTLSYENNTKIGTALVLVKGIGNYTSTRKINFKIVPKQVKNLRQVSKTASTIKISWDKDKQATAYIVYRANSKNGKYIKVGVTKNNYFTNKNLSSKKTYYYKVKADKKVDSAYYYGDLSDCLKTTTK